LTKKDIRLQYSGFLVFTANMLTVITGLLFQVMISAATLPPSREYDIWFNVNDLIPYFTLMSSVFPFWVLRFVARDKEGAAKTGVMANLSISLAVTVIYLSLVPVITSLLGVQANYLPIYLVISVQIIELYLLPMLEACLQAKIPHTVGYGLIIQEIGRVGFGYLLIVQLQQGVLGAVIAIAATFSVKIVFYLKLVAAELKARVRWEYAKEWLKGSVANMYNVAGNYIANYVFIMLFTYVAGARGIYGAAALIATVITFSSSLAFAMYPKLLADRKSEDITTSLKMVLMFAIPMTLGAIALADSYMMLIVMDLTFKNYASVLVVTALDYFVFTLSTFFTSVLYGLETVDETSKISFKKLVRSRLFLVFSLPYLHSAITIPTTFFVLSNYAQGVPSQAAFYVSIINGVARFAMFIILLALVSRMIRIEVPWRNIAKYVFASAVMAAFLFAIPHPERRYLILAVTGVAGAIYLSVLLVIDKEARALVRAVWQEIKNRII
jgi:hypothetical protein